MEMRHFNSLSVKDDMHAREAQREARELAQSLGFSETQAGRAAIAVTEAATNLIKHGGGGEILMRGVVSDGTQGLEVLALDKGPGMDNLHQCMRDGYSTGSSSGTGLGAMTRQADFFDGYSQQGKGTALFMQFWTQVPRAPHLSRQVDVGGLSTPKQGEDVCGDGWAVKQFVDTIQLLISDGLGHGDAAAQATREAIRIFEKQNNGTPVDILRQLHLGLKSTRGAAAAILEANAAAGTIRYAGVGNTVAAAGARHMVSHNGTLGHSAAKIQEFHYTWPEETLLVLMTDGLLGQWSLAGYPGIAQRHPTLIAGVLFRDFNRGRDDATVIVAKRRAA